MKSRSSIFSFDSLDLRGLRPWGLLTCLVILLAVELGLARSERLWSRFPKSPSGIVDVVEQEVINKARHPMVIVLGDSRSRDAVLPIEMEQVLGLQRGNVLNLSLTAGTPFDSYILYRRNRAKLRQAKVLLLAVEDWQLSDGHAVSERYRRFATLADRLAFPEMRRVPSLVAGWLWRTFDARKPLGRLGKEMVLQRDRSVPIGADGRLVWRSDEPEFGPTSIDVQEDLKRAYNGFRPAQMKSSNNMQYLQRVIDMATEDGVEVALICPPFRDAFVAAREALFRDELASEDAGVTTPDEAFNLVLDALARDNPKVRTFVVARARDLSIDATCFIDYGHMLRRGAELYSQALAHWLQKNYPALMRMRRGQAAWQEEPQRTQRKGKDGKGKPQRDLAFGSLHPRANQRRCCHPLVLAKMSPITPMQQSSREVGSGTAATAR